MTRWCSAIAIVLIIAMYSGVVFSDNVKQNEKTLKRNDIIRMDASTLLQKNERPAVLFFHDLHTEALSENKSGCTTCHIKNGDTISFQFISPNTDDKDERMHGYHDRCIACHTSFLTSGKKGGPVICSGCHREQPDIENTAVSGRFDKSLHQRHSDALDKSCKTCHHVYDAVNKKTVYEKGKEGSCSYCHPEKDNGKDLRLEQASHRLCITCHEKRIESEMTAGPVHCEGCHDQVKRTFFKKADKIDRLPMGQKDFLMLQSPQNVTSETNKSRMDLVPFDHLNHEDKNASCSVCHHKALTACTQCHTLDGSEKGGYNTLEKIMHDKGSEQSCTGCHDIKRQAAECSGCHGFDVARISDTRSCTQCHLAKGVDENQQKQAQELIMGEIGKEKSYDFSKIPETLNLNKMEKKYQPVVFPHRKIVKTLFDKTSNSRMAQYFHQDKNTLCLGCHHHTPETDNPTSCSRCHNIDDLGNDNHRPGLLGAYHIQCMECHVRMDIRQPENCTQCHKEKS